MGIKDVVEKGLEKGLEKGKEFADDPVETIKAGIDKAEELADKATGGKISDKIIAAGDQVEKLLPHKDDDAGS